MRASAGNPTHDDQRNVRYDRSVQETADSTRTYAESQRQLHPEGPVPGLLLVFSDGLPRCQAVAVSSTGLVIGRGHEGLEDPHLSREHVRVSVAERGLLV